MFTIKGELTVAAKDLCFRSLEAQAGVFNR